MIYIIITAYGEPKLTEKAITSFLSQNIKEKYKIIVMDPFEKTEEFLKQKFQKDFNKTIQFFLDPGEGKSYALNILLEKIYSKNTEDIIILTDGDVFVSENSVNELLKAFENEKIGCVTGRPLSINSKNNMFGYWSHFLFAGIDKVRDKLSKREKFLECSGYLFAIRNSVLKGFPIETSEDSIIPFLFWKRDYQIKYVPKAEVYVFSPQTWKSWKNQKIRNIKAHENLNKIAKDLPRTKSFLNEIKEGVLFSLKYPRNLKELYYTFILYFARLYVYLQAFYEIRFTRKTYSDGWRAIK